MPRSARQAVGCCEQCDQLLEQNVAQFFPNNVKMVATVLCPKSTLLQNSPKGCIIFGQLLLQNVQPKLGKNSQIWPHWLRMSTVNFFSLNHQSCRTPQTHAQCFLSSVVGG